jgi:CheY-like chemotaxis protein
MMYAVAKGILNLHGGKISFYSGGEDHGCTFTLTLPVYRAEVAQQVSPLPRTNSQVHLLSFGDGSYSILSIDRRMQRGARNSIDSVPSVGIPSLAGYVAGSVSGSRRSSAGTPTFRPTNMPHLRTALIVDDAAMNRKVVCRLIGDDCNSVWQAGDGIEAVELVRQAPNANVPMDAVLMDYEMPGMNGPTAARAMRNLGFEGAIIGVTGNTLSSYTSHFIMHGANNVLAKPVDLQLLKDAILGTLSLLFSSL